MLLSDVDLRKVLQSGELVVDGWTDPNKGGDWCIRPASMLLHLGREFRMFGYMADGDVIDPEDPPDMHSVAMDRYVLLPPGGFILGHTVEHVRFPNWLAGKVDGRSTLARLGLQVHQTAGHIDPGFAGQITLELHNVAHKPIKLRVGMAIVKMEVMRLTSAAEKPYGAAGVESPYQNQAGATAPIGPQPAGELAMTNFIVETAPVYPDKHEPPTYPVESLTWADYYADGGW